MNNNQNLNSLPTFPTQGIPTSNTAPPPMPEPITKQQPAQQIPPSTNNNPIPTTVQSAIPGVIPSSVTSAIPNSVPPEMPQSNTTNQDNNNRFINPQPIAPSTNNLQNNNENTDTSNNIFINNNNPIDTSIPKQDAPQNNPSISNNEDNNSYGANAIDSLNVKGNYNQLEQEPSYVNDPQVRENMNPTKKNTVTISKELKTVIIIALILLVFIFVIPTIFEFINNARFN